MINRRMNKIYYFLFSLFLSLQVSAAELQETFVVTIHDKFVKVVAPDKFHSRLSVILENKSLVKIYGKIEYGSAEPIYTSIYPQESRSIDIKPGENDKIIFTPMSPPFQEIELIFGRKSYEIPPQK